MLSNFCCDERKDEFDVHVIDDLSKLVVCAVVGGRVLHSETTTQRRGAFVRYKEGHRTVTHEKQNRTKMAM